jgi:hypothetical protein
MNSRRFIRSPHRRGLRPQAFGTNRRYIFRSLKPEDTDEKNKSGLGAFLQNQGYEKATSGFFEFGEVNKPPVAVCYQSNPFISLLNCLPILADASFDESSLRFELARVCDKCLSSHPTAQVQGQSARGGRPLARTNVLGADRGAPGHDLRPNSCDILCQQNAIAERNGRMAIR